MRTLYRVSAILTAVFVLFFSFGCDPDTGGGVGGGGLLGPEIQLNTGVGLVSFNQELPLDTASFIVNITANDGDAPLESLSITENGTIIPFERLTFRTGQTANNPILITGADAGGFTYEIEIEPGVAGAGDATYEFRVEDTENRTANTVVIISYTSNPPVAELLIADGFVSSNTTITASVPAFQVRLALNDGDNLLTSLEILEDGELLPAEALSFNGGAFSSANPLVFIEAEQMGVTYDISISPTGAENSTRNYTFRVLDAGGVAGETTVTITFDTPTTDLTFDTTGVFFNASGGMDGGLDLDNGMAVPFNSPEAEIQDEGIDLNTAGENWRAQISGENGAEVRIGDLSVLGDGVTFDDVLLSSEISAVFDAGATPDGNDNFPDADGDTSASEVVTQPLNGGEILVVRRDDGRTYLVRIDDVNFVSGSNNDSYTVSIKY